MVVLVVEVPTITHRPLLVVQELLAKETMAELCLVLLSEELEVVELEELEVT
jgi:hypothetical protein